MSAGTTYRAQLARLRLLGLSVAEQPPLRDVDRSTNAWAVALEAPNSALPRRWPRYTARRSTFTATDSSAGTSCCSARSMGSQSRWRSRAGLARPTKRTSRLSAARGARCSTWSGPGRHLHALARRGVYGLGVDLCWSPSRSRGSRRVCGRRLDLRRDTRRRNVADGAAARRQHRYRRRSGATATARAGAAAPAAARCSSSSTHRTRGRRPSPSASRPTARRADGSAGRAWRSVTSTRSRRSPGSGWSLAGGARRAVVRAAKGPTGGLAASRARRRRG